MIAKYVGCGLHNVTMTVWTTQCYYDGVDYTMRCGLHNDTMTVWTTQCYYDGWRFSATQLIVSSGLVPVAMLLIVRLLVDKHVCVHVSV